MAEFYLQFDFVDERWKLYKIGDDKPWGVFWDKEVARKCYLETEDWYRNLPAVMQEQAE